METSRQNIASRHTYIVALVIGVLFCHTANGQLIDGYEYWFDNNYSSRIEASFTGVEDYEFSEDLPTAGLTPGLHKLHVRFHQDDDTWGATANHNFFIPSEPVSGTTVAIAQIWYDHDIASSTTINLGNTPTAVLNQALNTSGLSEGFHVVSLRVQDDEGFWSAPVNRRLWFDATGIPQVVEYRYWFDGDFSTSIQVVIDQPDSPYVLDTSISTSMVDLGPNHQFCVQFMNSDNVWSAPFCALFDNYSGCLGDLNGDGFIDTSDLLIFLGNFGCSVACEGSDLNFDGGVDSQDLLLFLGALGSYCE